MSFRIISTQNSCILSLDFQRMVPAIHLDKSTLNTMVGLCGIPQTRFWQKMVMVSFFRLAYCMVMDWVWEEPQKCKALPVAKVLEIGSLVETRCLLCWLMIAVSCHAI